MADRVAAFMAGAQDSPVELPVVALLNVFDLRARTPYAVLAIHLALSAAGLTCEPDLREGSRDDTVRVGRWLHADARLTVQTGNSEESR
jgi:hypothetical protein